MSYEIVRGIKVKENGEIWVKAASNNVYPRSYYWERWTYAEKIMAEKGIDGYNLMVLRAYEEGIFQPGTPNKYSRAIDRLYKMPEYKKFSWRCGMGEEYERAKEAREQKEFDELILKAFYEKPKKKKKTPCIIAANVASCPVWFKKRTKNGSTYTYAREAAKVFNHVEDAEEMMEHFKYQTGRVVGQQIEMLLTKKQDNPVMAAL